MLRTRLYFSNVVLTKMEARKLIDFVTKKSPKGINKWGYWEPLKNKWQDKYLESASIGLSGYPEYHEGTLFLQANKKEITYVFNYFFDKLITLDIYLKGRDKKVENLFIRFVIDFCKEFQVLFSFIATQEEFDSKNYFTEHNQPGESSEYLGLDLDSGLPGVYWFTFFSESLYQSLQIGDIEKINICKLKNNGGYIQFGKSPYDNEAESQSKIKKVIEQIGADYFFDINQPFEHKRSPRPIEVLLQQKLKLDPSVIPLYSDESIKFRNEDVPVFLKRLINSNSIISSFLEYSNLDITDNLVNELTKELSKPKDKNGYIEKVCEVSAFLGDLYCKKYDAVWDDEKQGNVSFNSSSLEILINPINVTRLLFEDDLSLEAFEENIESYFD